jgi:hypothetical protein
MQLQQASILHHLIDIKSLHLLHILCFLSLRALGGRPSDLTHLAKCSFAEYGFTLMGDLCHSFQPMPEACWRCACLRFSKSLAAGKELQCEGKLRTTTGRRDMGVRPNVSNPRRGRKRARVNKPAMHVARIANIAATERQGLEPNAYTSLAEVIVE